jgi:hypothetical protein
MIVKVNVVARKYVAADEITGASRLARCDKKEIRTGKSSPKVKMERKKSQMIDAR